MKHAELSGLKGTLPYLLFKIRKAMVAFNENLSRKFFMAEEALVKAESGTLGLTYVGAQRNRARAIEFYLITDPENGSTFAVKPVEMVRANLERHRRNYEERTHGEGSGKSLSAAVCHVGQLPPGVFQITFTERDEGGESVAGGRYGIRGDTQ